MTVSLEAQALGYLMEGEVESVTVSIPTIDGCMTALIRVKIPLQKKIEDQAVTARLPP